MFVRANFVDIYSHGVRDRSMRRGAELAREIKLIDWSMAGNLSKRSSGVCTRLKCYLYSAKCSWIIRHVICTIVLSKYWSHEWHESSWLSTDSPGKLNDIIKHSCELPLFWILCPSTLKLRKLYLCLALLYKLWTLKYANNTLIEQKLAKNPNWL